MKHLLIDGDEFVHKAAAATEHETRWDEENHVLHSNEKKAFDILRDMLRRCFERFESTTYTMCFSAPRPYFRETLWDLYKAKRGDRKPMCFGVLKETVLSKCPCQLFAGLEGDDVMGILATQPGADRIIVSQDKDMRTIPATVWDGKTLYTYSEAEADYWHMWQTLVGDSSDGYHGCPGIGAVRASRLLDEARDKVKLMDALDASMSAHLWPTVLTTFVKANLKEEDAILEARLARILRWDDWDRKEKKPILWVPTQTPNNTSLNSSKKS